MLQLPVHFFARLKISSQRSLLRRQVMNVSRRIWQIVLVSIYFHLTNIYVLDCDQESKEKKTVAWIRMMLIESCCMAMGIDGNRQILNGKYLVGGLSWDYAQVWNKWRKIIKVQPSNSGSPRKWRLKHFTVDYSDLLFNTVNSVKWKMLMHICVL